MRCSPRQRLRPLSLSGKGIDPDYFHNNFHTKIVNFPHIHKRKMATGANTLNIFLLAMLNKHPIPRSNGGKPWIHNNYILL